MTLTARLVSTGATNVATFVLAVANSILLTRLLGPQGRGEFAIFTASSSLLVLVLLVGFDFSLSYFVAQGRVRLDAVPASALAYSVLAGCVSLLVIMLGDRLLEIDVFLPSSKQRLSFEVLLAALVFAGVAFAAARAVLLGTRSFNAVNLIDVGAALASVGTYSVILGLAERWWPRIPPGGLLAVYTGLSLVAAAMMWGTFLRRVGLRRAPEFIDRRVAGAMLGLGLKAYLSNILQFLNYRFDYWIVGYFAGFRTLGLYSLASSLAQVFWLLPKSAATVFLPVFASGERRDTESQALVGRLILFLAAAAATVAAWLSGWWIPLLFGRAFEGASRAFTILLVGGVPYTLSIVLASGLAARGLQSENTKASGWGFAATVLLDLLLIPRFGMMGAAAASSLSYLATTGYVLWRFSSAFEIPLSRLLFVQPGDTTLITRALRGLGRIPGRPGAGP